MNNQVIIYLAVFVVSIYCLAGLVNTIDTYKNKVETRLSQLENI